MIASKTKPIRMDSRPIHTICGVFCRNRCVCQKWTTMDVTNARDRIARKATRNVVHCNATYGKFTMLFHIRSKSCIAHVAPPYSSVSSVDMNVADGKTFGAWYVAKDLRRAHIWNGILNRRFVCETICSEMQTAWNAEMWTKKTKKVLHRQTCTKWIILLVSSIVQCLLVQLFIHTHFV